MTVDPTKLKPRRLSSLPKFEASCLIWRKAGVLERRLIHVERLAIRSEYGNELRNHVDDRPKFRFGLSHFGQGFGQGRLARSRSIAMSAMCSACSSSASSSPATGCAI